MIAGFETEKSRRVLMLLKVCLNALHAHRTRQLEERLRAGADWIEAGLVFTTYARRGNGRKVGVGLHLRNVLRTLHTCSTPPDRSSRGYIVESGAGDRT